MVNRVYLSMHVFCVICMANTSTWQNLQKSYQFLQHIPLLEGCQPPLTASHIHIGCTQSVLAPYNAVDRHMGASLCCITCAGGGEFLENWSMAEPV
jgi:hypothetical protein